MAWLKVFKLEIDTSWSEVAVFNFYVGTHLQNSHIIEFQINISITRVRELFKECIFIVTQLGFSFLPTFHPNILFGGYSYLKKYIMCTRFLFRFDDVK